MNKEVAVHCKTLYGITRTALTMSDEQEYALVQHLLQKGGKENLASLTASDRRKLLYGWATQLIQKEREAFDTECLVPFARRSVETFLDALAESLNASGIQTCDAILKRLATVDAAWERVSHVLGVRQSQKQG
ncbi:hypothetical protein IMZ31_19240 (plasmid) [Pontibacillus sp. ALD_SL1]|uniref:hypothetical protein n=1 Tax=Pontibacillus sp. ALD_SL1 TaxID=2777185 RepID=UPI001A9790AD|nr:hypothetical protein [Pontibacillus sp. ALD_SL1]QST02686.1 hypothetical protein IMZ31_19240 [Pontibacillus sp. ALD_SL1]